MERTVLVVDDSCDFLTMVEMALEPIAAEKNLCILHATNGQEALSLLEKHPLSAVLLTDLAMPEMGGLELIAQCRKQYPLLQVVVLSSSSDGGSVIEAVRAGASDYIIKPPSIADLERSITQALARYEKLGKALQMQERLRGYERELAIAADIQRHMLPPPIAEDDEHRYRVSALLVPARHVAGDFYDHWHGTDGKVILCIGDVSGKGISAALWMAVTKTLLRSHLESGQSPVLAMEKVNRVLAANNPQAYFVTALIALFNPHTGELTLANAAHPAPYRIRSDGTLEQLLTPRGMPLGALESSTYQSASYFLERGDRLVLFTDGILDTIASDLGAQNTVWETFLGAAIQAPGKDLTATIIAKLSTQWIAEHFPDDITIVTLEYGSIADAETEHSQRLAVVAPMFTT